MLVRGQRRIAIALSPLLALIIIVGLCSISSFQLNAPEYLDQWSSKIFRSRNGETEDKQEILQSQAPTIGVAESHHEVFSRMNKGGRYFSIDFGGIPAINPNIIPHPYSPDTYYIVAQAFKRSDTPSAFHVELVCEAAFEQDNLRCLNPPMILPIAATSSPHCKGKFDQFNLNIGPHDARMFYGPEKPYVMYGSNSARTCFGLWMQDFTILVKWPDIPAVLQPFRFATDLQRPPPYREVEKNWFVFWDSMGAMYIHYDVAPTRVFAKLASDGSVGKNLAPAAKLHDDVCLQSYMPAVPPEAPESIHQATNSLSITLCNRVDPACTATDANTLIFSIFQHKKFYDFHSVYEPYVMLFRRTAPFEMHSISSKPIWLHGRGAAGEKRPAFVEAGMEWTQTEMMYITSMSWQSQTQKYHGYLDDTLFLAFGIEDTTTAGMDVLAGDLLAELSLCDSL